MRQTQRRRSASPILLLAVLGLAVALVISPIASASGSLTWNSTTSYPVGSGNGIQDEPCVTYSGYIYCVGGNTPFNGIQSSVYYAKLSSTGGISGSWATTASYGSPIYFESCAVDSGTGYVYCVGGVDTTQVSTVYYAKLSSSGGITGSWTETTDYGAASGSSGSGGQALSYLSCATYSGYIYCVGGQSSISAIFNTVYYAKLSSSGGITGGWSTTTNYPIQTALTSCDVYNGYLYCVGGEISTSPYATSAVYYAQLSSSGGITGSWAETTDYGAASGSSGSGGVDINAQSCVISSGSYMFCIAGYAESGSVGKTSAVYYAQLSSTGAGPWTSATAYGGGSTEDMGCASYSGYVYCVGGSSFLSGVYYAQTASAVPDLPYGVIPFLLAIPALYYLISRRQASRGTRGPSLGGNKARRIF